MIVYRDTDEAVAPGPVLAECRRQVEAVAGGTGGHAEAVDALIAYGEIEAALADALFAQADGFDPRAARLRRAALGLGRLAYRTWKGGPAGGAGAAAREAANAIAQVEALHLPSPVRRRVAEGYAWYALYPECYLLAAERFARETGASNAVCIGIRSIGTSLSAAVGAALEAEGWQVDTLTLRPRGHPFDRRPVLAPDLEAHLRRQVGSWFLVVDEGPGLSGSSLCGTAEMLSELGIPDERIVLFPAWLPDGNGFVSETARRRWRRHRKAHAGFEETGLPDHGFGAPELDLSAGRWREALLPLSSWPAVQPQHEKRKYRLRWHGRAALLRFAGLGRHGRSRAARAERLAAAGFGPAPRGLAHGFLALDWIEGRPLDAGSADPSLLARAADYLVHLRRTEATGEAVRTGDLARMIETNIAEGLGPEWLGRLAGLDAHLRHLEEVPAVRIDGRMMPHEWIATAGGFVKTDALDHHDDHFFPGPQDIAWDIAGLAVEFGLGATATADLVRAVAAGTKDPGLGRRLPVQMVGYLAFRLGYASMAAASLGAQDDGRRFAALAERYRARLKQAISAWPEAGTDPRSAV